MNEDIFSKLMSKPIKYKSSNFNDVKLNDHVGINLYLFQAILLRKVDDYYC